VSDTGLTLSGSERDELVRRLIALRELAAGLVEAFDDARARAGAGEMVASIERMLELVGGAEGAP
jgi:hypothetical protein